MRAKALEIYGDSIRAGDRALIVDDVLASGGSALAAVQLVNELGVSVWGWRALPICRMARSGRRLNGEEYRSSH